MAPTSRDGAGGPESGELRPVVAQETAQRLVGMLAHGGHRADAGRGPGELDRRAGQVHLAGKRVLHFHQHLALPEMWILGHLRDGTDGRRGNPCLVELRAYLVRRPLRAPLLDEHAATVGACAARHRRAVSFGAGATGDLHEACGHLPPCCRDDHEAVLRLVRGPAALAAFLAGGEIVGGRDLYHGEGRVEETDVDHLAFAGALAVAERGQRADRGVERGVAIDDGRRGADRLALRLASQRHEARHGLPQRVESWPLAVWPVLTEAGYRYEDDPAVQDGQPLVVEAHRAHDTRPDVLEHDIRLGDEGREDLLALRMPKVEADALLAPVVHGEVHALPADHGRMLARLLAARRLDLDHLGAQVGEQHAAARARLEARQFEDADAVEATRHGGRLGGQG